MQLTDFDYELPPELIASFPLAERSASRLLCLDSVTGDIQHKLFTDLDDILAEGDLLIANNSKVIPARLLGNKASGGRIEVLIERILNENCVLAHVRASKAPKPGSLLHFNDHIVFKVIGRQDELFELCCLSTEPVLEVIEAIGNIPIPPYFQRDALELDKERYQTIYALSKGSVAAPTAGLHFDHKLLEKLKNNNIELDYVTLHVGAGTFAPVRVDDITQHKMHAERVTVTQELCNKIKTTKANGGRVIAVGTTSARSLEAASLSGQLKAYDNDTNIFIYPGFKFNTIDGLITNFHLPNSTLLMLVSALGGYLEVKAAYAAAIEQQYRFFSYGDAMLILARRGDK